MPHNAMQYPAQGLALSTSIPPFIAIDHAK